MDSEEKTPLKETEMVHVNDKFDWGWPADMIYSDWNVRIVLRYLPSIVASYHRKVSMSDLLEEKFGKENEDWILIVNSERTGQDELYLKNLSNLFFWKLQDVDGVKEHIEGVYIFEGEQ